MAHDNDLQNKIIHHKGLVDFGTKIHLVVSI